MPFYKGDFYVSENDAKLLKEIYKSKVQHIKQCNEIIFTQEYIKDKIQNIKILLDELKELARIYNIENAELEDLYLFVQSKNKLK
jgi:hypothetical protein